MIPEVPLTTEIPVEPPSVTDDIVFETPPTGVPIVESLSPVPGIDVYPEEVVAMGEVFGIITGVLLTIVALMYVGK